MHKLCTLLLWLLPHTASHSLFRFTLQLGRYKVVDLEASEPGKPAQRLVDTRTVTEVVVEGVRYYTA